MAAMRIILFGNDSIEGYEAMMVGFHHTDQHILDPHTWLSPGSKAPSKCWLDVCIDPDRAAPWNAFAVAKGKKGKDEPPPPEEETAEEEWVDPPGPMYPPFSHAIRALALECCAELMQDGEIERRQEARPPMMWSITVRHLLRHYRAYS
eukprot:scaffold63428_cov27-Prasinocladus_malaysianus.AAC.1